MGCGDDDDDAAPARMEPNEALAIEDAEDAEDAEDLNDADASVEPEVQSETLAPAPDGTSAPRDTPSALEDVRSGDELIALDTADLRRSISPISERWLGQLVYSKLLRFQDVAAAELAPDLATALPEVTDASTLVFELNPAARRPGAGLSARKMCGRPLSRSGTGWTRPSRGMIACWTCESRRPGQARCG